MKNITRFIVASLAMLLGTAVISHATLPLHTGPASLVPGDMPPPDDTDGFLVPGDMPPPDDTDGFLVPGDMPPPDDTDGF